MDPTPLLRQNSATFLGVIRSRPLTGPEVVAVALDSPAGEGRRHIEGEYERIRSQTPAGEDVAICSLRVVAVERPEEDP